MASVMLAWPISRPKRGILFNSSGGHLRYTRDVYGQTLLKGGMTSRSLRRGAAEDKILFGFFFFFFFFWVLKKSSCEFFNFVFL